MPKREIYTATALISASSLMLEILLTRIISVVAWYHLSFFVISLAMLGMTVGAGIVFVMPSRFSTARAAAQMFRGSLGFALLTPVVAAASLSLPIYQWYAEAPFLSLLLYGSLLAVPFIFSGMALTVALTRTGLPPGVIYGFDLVGASAGCVLVIPLLRLTDAPSAILMTAVLASVAALVYGLTDSNRRRIAVMVIVPLVVVAVVNAAMPTPLLRPVWSKWSLEYPDKFVFVGWNSYSRVTVEKTDNVEPSDWSLGIKTPVEAKLPIPQRRILIDGAAATWIAQDSNMLDAHKWADWDLCSIAHFIRPKGAAATIGVGGGRDLIAAARAGHDKVVGIELNPLILSLHEERMREFSGLAKLPQVELVVGEARSYLAQDHRKYSVITMSLIDTWASQGSGAFSLAENGLYTVEAWELFLSRLEPNGLFSVSRWFYDKYPHETVRMLSLACETLFRRGVSHPINHIILASNAGLCTMLVSPSPIPKADVAKMQKELHRMGGFLLAAPGGESGHPVLRRILAQTNSAGLLAETAKGETDLSPPTDDRPFFFNALKVSTWLKRTEEVDQMNLTFLGYLEGTRTLVYAIGVSLLLTVLFIVLPLLGRRRDLSTWPGVEVGSACAYFALIGLGFMFVEIGMLSRLNVFLGQPTLALAVLLGGIILFSGLGSMLSSYVPVEKKRRAVLFPLIPAVLTAAAAAATVPIQQTFDGSPLAVRVVIGALLVMAPALGMGICFPLGLRLVGRLREADARRADLGPWLWGINGAFGVCASGLALACSMAFGIHVTLEVGSSCYWALVIFASILASRARKG